jgi:hypothetical protein
VPQLIPAGEEITLPEPLLLTVKVLLTTFWLNVAVTLRAAVIETVQLALVPLHAPLQPEKL